MKKFKKWLLIPVITSSAALLPLMSAGCKDTKNDVDHSNWPYYPGSPYSSNQGTNQNGHSKVDLSNIRDFEEINEEEQSAIENYLNNHIPEIVPKKGYSINDYYLTPNLIENDQIEFELNNSKYVALLSNTDLTNKVDVHERTTEANHIFNTKRKYTYKFFKFNTDKNKWAYVDDFIWTFQQPITVDFVLPSTISTSFTDELKVPININWEALKNHWVEAKIVGWADGDTPKFVITKKPTLWRDNDAYVEKFNNQTKLSLRIQGIDTPEKNVGPKESTPFEHQYAELSTAFGENNIPIGTPIRIFLNGQDTFGREVGDFFFGEGFKYSYSVSITNAGLTLPLVTDHEVISNYKNKTMVDHYTLIPLANAFNTAFIKRRGYFINFHTPSAISNYIYLMKQNNLWTSLWIGTPDNIYKKLKVKFNIYN